MVLKSKSLSVIYQLWNTFKHSLLQVCDEICQKNKVRKNHWDKWWWNEEVKEAILQKKVAYTKMCESRLDENKARYENIKNRAKKVVAYSMRKDAEKKLTKMKEL